MYVRQNNSLVNPAKCVETENVDDSVCSVVNKNRRKKRRSDALLAKLLKTCALEQNIASKGLISHGFPSYDLIVAGIFRCNRKSSGLAIWRKGQH